MQPLVLPVELSTFERRGRTDYYLPEADGPRPAVLVVHGGPVPAQFTPTPRDWPVYRAYGSLMAQRGVVAVTVDHRLHDPTAYVAAAEDVANAVEAMRVDPRVDANRIGLWFFSGGGPLMADYLRTRPDWLRVIAATYPVLGERPGRPLDPRFRPVEAIAAAGDLPIVLTRVGREDPAVAATVEAFIEAATAAGAESSIREGSATLGLPRKPPSLTTIDVPDGEHGFDVLNDTDESRAAILGAVERVLSYLAAHSAG